MALAVGFAGLATLGTAYTPTLISLHEKWSINGHYSHGYLMLALVLWFVWHRRGELVAAVGRPCWPAVLALFAESALWLVFDLVQVQILQQLILPVIAWTWLLVVLGWRAARLLMLPIAFVYFAIPVWDFLIMPLRELTVWVNSALLDLMGIPAYIEGTYVTLAVGTFYVAGGCSGLSYLLTSLLLAAVYGSLYVHRWSRRLVLVGISIAMGLVCNWIRVFGLVLIGHWTQMQSGMIAEHGFYGWLLYALMLPGYLWVAGRLEDGGPPAAVAVGPHTGNSRSGSLPAVLLATALGAAGPATVSLVQFVQVPENNSVARWPDIPGWQRTGQPEFGFEPEYVGFDDARIEGWRHEQTGASVDTLTLTYRVQRQGKELVSDLNRIAPEQDTLLERTIGAETAGLQHAVTETLVDSDRRLVLVWSWYDIRGRRETSPIAAKLAQVTTFFKGGAVRLVTVTSDCVTESCTDTRDRLAAVASAL